jgi:SAM-dependent methyltransferase
MGQIELMTEDRYHEIRLPFDPRREVLWRALWKFHFSKYIGASDCVLDLGCGYGHFINNVKAKRRVGIDNWPGFLEHLTDGVEGHVGNASDLSFLADRSVDFAFANNLTEHLTKQEFGTLLSSLRKKLTDRGFFAAMQPNYRYAYKEYFDDYTHVTVYSHESLCDFLEANKFWIVKSIPRFMPLTLKNSKMVVSEPLIRLYLNLPLKPLGKQMFVLAKPAKSS